MQQSHALFAIVSFLLHFLLLQGASEIQLSSTIAIYVMTMMMAMMLMMTTMMCSLVLAVPNHKDST